MTGTFVIGMNSKLTLVLPFALCCFCIGSATDGGGDGAGMATCTAPVLKRLEEPGLKRSFFASLDSIRRVQYPNNDQDTTQSVDISPSILTTFLNRLDYQAFSAKGEAEMEFQFKIAPAGYSDPPVCTDKVTIQFFPDHCSFRMVITSHFLVPPNWCTGQQVVYGFRIGEDKILDFWRDEAG